MHFMIIVLLGLVNWKLLKSEGMTVTPAGMNKLGYCLGRAVRMGLIIIAVVLTAVLVGVVFVQYIMPVAPAALPVTITIGGAFFLLLIWSYINRPRPGGRKQW